MNKLFFIFSFIFLFGSVYSNETKHQNDFLLLKVLGQLGLKKLI